VFTKIPGSVIKEETSGDLWADTHVLSIE
jgi:hypothetical protein